MRDQSHYSPPRGGPLSGLTVLELAAIGPLPFACMMLADLGANVVRVDRPEQVDRVAIDPIAASMAGRDHLGRGRRRIAIDLKREEGVETLLKMVGRADIFVESFRPGVAERLGIGPREVMAKNPGIIYGRVSGWGRTGPLANAAGHDVNYIALAGVIDTLRPRGGGVPINPVGHIGDFGGGGMLLVAGLLAALHERTKSGLGQVVDSSILDGGLLLNTLSRYLSLNDQAAGPPGTNALDGGSHFFGAYETSDSGYVVFGALEPAFHDEMMRGLGIDPRTVDQHDRAAWPTMRQRIADIVRKKSREEWQRQFEGSDACFGPVLRTDEVHLHPHHIARRSFVDIEGQLQAAPAPRFSRTPAADPAATRAPGQDSVNLLTEFGFDEASAQLLVESGAVFQDRSTYPLTAAGHPQEESL